MKITIDQAEIETAIKAHIASQVSVKEGMSISVDLRATRGETGMQANITIAPEGEVVAKATGPVAARQIPAPTVAIVRRAPLTAVPATPKAEVQAVAQEVQVQGIESVEETGEKTGEVVQDNGVDEGDPADEQAEEAATVEPVAVAPVAPAGDQNKTKSLFGGLRKPVNRPTAA